MSARAPGGPPTPPNPTQPHSANAPSREHEIAKLGRELDTITERLREEEARRYNADVRAAAKRRAATDGEVVLVAVGAALTSVSPLLATMSLPWIAMAAGAAGLAVLASVARRVHARREGPEEPSS